METNFKIETNNQNDDNGEIDNNIIILDDDDFIQTTFNLLSKNSSSPRSPLPSSCLSLENHLSYANNCTSQNVPSTNFFNNNNNNNKNNILIDLTCDDFDLNDLFMIHSNNEIQEQNQTNNNNQIDSAQIEVSTIKNEFDFKVFNFNIKDFTSCIEEILIDDEDDEEILNADRSNDLMAPIQQQQQQQQLTTDFSSFKNYRNTNDSSSDTSCTTKNSIHNRTNPVYKCDHCSKTFNKSFNYKRHLYVHSSKEISSNSGQFKRVPNECPNCKRRILDKSNFTKHLKLCSQKMLTKKIKYFSYPSSQTTPSDEIEKNNLLDEKNKISQIVNKASNVMPKTFECELCKKIFSKKFNYHRHIRMHFLNEIMNHQHDPTNEYRTSSVAAVVSGAGITPHFFACNSCPRKFNENKQLVMHERKWHLDTFECEYCRTNKPKFSGKFDYIKHLNLSHKIHFKFKCKYCCKHFQFMSQYIQHRQNHLIKNGLNDTIEEDEVRGFSQKQINCNLCARKFSNIFNLKRHRDVRHPGLYPGLDKEDEVEKNLPNQANSNMYSNSIKLKIDCNTNQKNFYERNKLNFHLNKIQINK